MIDILFKECCGKCPHIDVDYDSVSGHAEQITVIGCRHACVCKDYNNAEETDENCQDVSVKGFCNAD